MVFETEWHSCVTTPIPPDVDPTAVIEILHDHSFLITCSPIVTRHCVQERSEKTGWMKYEVFEVVDILPFGVWKREISFQVYFQDKPDGVVSFIEAPMGLISEASYTVKQAEASDGKGDGFVLREEIDSSCNAMLKHLVQSNMLPVRKRLHLQAIEGARKKRGIEPPKEDASPAS